MRKKIKQKWIDIVETYWRYERHISSVALFAGFAFNIFTLKRVDLFLENLWVGVHLGVAAIGILALNFFEGTKRIRGLYDETRTKIHFWLVILIQFSFGGLFSTFLVFYFRSATLSTSWPFLLFLFATFVANERMRDHYTRLVFQISILFISIFSFNIFIVPVSVHLIGDRIFLLSGAISLAVISIFIILLRIISNNNYKKSRNKIFFSIISIFVFINILYFTNIIPPIPLSLKDAGVFHNLSSNGKGGFVVKKENIGTWFDYFLPYETYHTVSGEPVYFFSAVFSPTNLKANIIHDWQYFDETKNRWVSASRIKVPIVGGREDGYRLYSKKYNIFPALWRVDVENETGQVIGRLRFKIVIVGKEPEFSSETK